MSARTGCVNMKKKILFLHGFYASGSCVPALALKEAFKERATVLTPDLPLHPADAIRLILEICDREKPDILVGNSCGSFYAQMISPVIGVPALLGNPHFKMSDFLRERIGSHQYKSPRADGNQNFTITEELVKEFEEIEAHQFLDERSGRAERDGYNIYNKERVWGLFGEEDTLAHFEPLFLEHYLNSYHFPGGHTPTAEQFNTWYCPLIEKMLLEYPVSEDRARYSVEILLLIERIKRMEQRFNNAMAAIKDGSAVSLKAIKEDVAELSKYYSSELWKQDFAADEAGILPLDLKRGVLSEDGIWNLLSDYREFQKTKQ